MTFKPVFVSALLLTHLAVPLEAPEALGLDLLANLLDREEL